MFENLVPSPLWPHFILSRSSVSPSSQVRNMNSTRGPSPRLAWSSTCARARQRRTRWCGQSSRSSRPDVPTAPRRSSTKDPAPPPTLRDNGAGLSTALLKPVTHPPSLSLCVSLSVSLSFLPVSALTESLDAPHFSSTLSKNK